MNLGDIARIRMRAEMLSGGKLATPEAVVAHFGAMQAQDYPGALWAVAQRTRKATMQDIERAVAERRIVRSWPMRGTLHFMAGTDARWMLELLTPRANNSGGWATRRKFLGITDRDMHRVTDVVARTLAGGKVVTRPDLYAAMEKAGIQTKGQRGAHMLGKLAHEMLIVVGPRVGKQPTMVLLDDWLPRTKPVDRDDALTRVATRYFTSHGPATIKDFCWWSALTVTDAKRAIAGAGRKINASDIGGTTYYGPTTMTATRTTEAHLLPPFDELLVAFRDRSASLASIHHHHVSGSNNGFMQPTVVIDGQVVATWSRSTDTKHTAVTIKPFFTLSASAKRAIADASDRYSKYLGHPVRLR